MNKQHDQEGNEPVSAAFIDRIFQALVDSGSVIPETVDEVRRALAQLEHEPDTLPVHLRDSAQALARLHRQREASTEKVIPMPASDYAETLAGLQRAARKGADIPSEVEARMKANRLKAKHERPA